MSVLGTHQSTTQFLELVTILACERTVAIMSSPSTKWALRGFPLFPILLCFCTGVHDGLVCHKHNKCLSFLKYGVINFGFYIRVLSFMFLLVLVGLDKVFLGGHMFCFGCLFFFAVYIFYDNVSD